MSKGLETKEKILNVATQMVREGGLDCLTIGEVAKNAGLSKSGVFAHFASRDDLLIELIQFSAQDFRVQVFEQALLAKAGVARIRALSDLWVQWVDDKSGGCPFLSATFEFDDRPGPVRDSIVRVQKQATDIWEKAASLAIREKEFKPNIDSSQFAYEVFGNLLIYHLYKRLLNNSRSLIHYKNNFESILKNYLK